MITKQRIVLSKCACVRGFAIKMKDVLLDCQEDIYEDALHGIAHNTALVCRYVCMLNVNIINVNVCGAAESNGGWMDGC